MLLLAVAFLTSCSSKEQVAPADMVVEQEEVPKVLENNGSPVIVTVEQGGLVYAPEVLSLLEKSKNVTAYKYYFDTFKGGKYYEVFVREGKVRKVYSDVLKFGEEHYYNEVYLNSLDKEAVAVCTQGGVLCTSVWNKAFLVDYDTEKVSFVPVDLLFNLSYDAHKVGEEIFDNRKAVIIEFVNGKGMKEKLWLDAFYGVPLKQVVYDELGKEGEKHTFTHFIVGVSDEEVMLPASYERIN